MYVKVFTSLWTGSLCGTGVTWAVWVYLLAHADADGFVDEHPRSIATRTGFTEEQVREAIAVLVVQGKLPRPERIVMADTGREATLTWDYLRDSVQPLLATIGMQVEIAPHSLSTVDVYPKSGNGKPLIPAFTAEGAKLENYCSVEWKRRVVARWLRGQGYGPQRQVNEWLGISTDEVHRAKFPEGWIEHSYPLLDLRLSRSDCITLVQKAGLPEPPRSSCWMCPFRSDKEWMELRDRKDGDWLKAQLFEVEHLLGPGRGLYLHRSAKPLAEVSFRHENQGELFDVCEEGRCEF